MLVKKTGRYAVRPTFEMREFTYSDLYRSERVLRSWDSGIRRLGYRISLEAG